MKNFTNNFKQFTSRLSARWLIMALMMLVGTSSAWGWNKLVIWKSGKSSSEVDFNNGTAQITLSEAADYYFYINDNGNKKGLTSTEVKNSSNCKNMSFSGSADCGLRVASGETGLFTFTINSWNGSTPTVSVQYPGASTYLMGLGDWDNGKELPCKISLNAGTYEFKIKKGDTWYGNSGTMTSENSKNWTFGSDNNTNCQITINESGNYYFYVVWADNLPTVSVTYPCEPSNNNEIRIECVHTDAPNLYAWDTSGDLNGNWPGATMDGSDNIYYKEFTNTNSTESINIIFSDNGEQQTIDIKGLVWGKVYRYTRDGELIYSYCLAPACTTPQASDFTYTLPDDDNTQAGNEVTWDGNTHAATVSWNGTQGGDITIYYTKTGGNKTTTAPSAAGTYTVTIETTAHGDFCATKDPITLGTFTITCPVVDKPTIDEFNTTKEIIKCGDAFTQSAQIAITKVGDLTYTCKLNGTTNITIDNGTITEITTAGTYTITATNGCGNNASTDVEISLTDNTVSISAITGSETICADVTGQEYSITEIPDVSYAWSVTGEGLSTNSSTTNTVLISAEDKTSQVNGTLSVTVTKNGCETTIQQPKSITLIPLPTITTVDPTSGEACSSTTIADLEKELTFTKSENTSTQWYLNDTKKETSEQLVVGTYTIKAITNTGGCISSNKVNYEVTAIAESPDAPFDDNTTKPICASYTEFSLTELSGWNAEDPDNADLTIYWYTKNGDSYNATDDIQRTITANTFYARTKNTTGCYSEYVALVIPTPITPTTLDLTMNPSTGITTPWIPIKVTVDNTKGDYEVSYPNNLNTVTNVQITKKDNVYTYRIPRPSKWETGDDPEQNTKGKKEEVYTVRATLTAGSESDCPSMGEVTIRLQDEDNDKCTWPKEP